MSYEQTLAQVAKELRKIPSEHGVTPSEVLEDLEEVLVKQINNGEGETWQEALSILGGKRISNDE